MESISGRVSVSNHHQEQSAAASASGHPSNSQSSMAVVNVNLNNMINAKDSRWLQLEVCREFQRSKCSRSDSECKFAHPPANVEVQNGRVIACYDSIKVRTQYLFFFFFDLFFCERKNSNVAGGIRRELTKKQKTTKRIIGSAK